VQTDYKQRRAKPGHLHPARSWLPGYGHGRACWEQGGLHLHTTSRARPAYGRSTRFSASGRIHNDGFSTCCLLPSTSRLLHDNKGDGHVSRTGSCETGCRRPGLVPGAAWDRLRTTRLPRPGSSTSRAGSLGRLVASGAPPVRNNRNGTFTDGRSPGNGHRWPHGRLLVLGLRLDNGRLGRHLADSAVRPWVDGFKASGVNRTKGST